MDGAHPKHNPIFSYAVDSERPGERNSKQYRLETHPYLMGL